MLDKKSRTTLRKIAEKLAVDPEGFAKQYKQKWVKKPGKLVKETTPAAKATEEVVEKKSADRILKIILNELKRK